jgi:hypothetical protein
VDRGIRRRFRDGDPDPVRLVYRAYGRLVYAVAHRVLRDVGYALFGATAMRWYRVGA